MTAPPQTTDLGELTFDEFRRRFSTNEGVGPRNQVMMSPNPIYLAPNEVSVSKGFEAVKNLLDMLKGISPNPRVNFYGIVGGVDLTLSYIAEIWSRLDRDPLPTEVIALTDINHTALDYLAQRLDIFKRAGTIDEYFDILEKENPKSPKKLARYALNGIPREEWKHLWFFSKAKFNLLKRMAENGNIKAFQSNHYGSGQDVIAGLNKISKPDGVVVYLSDIAGVSDEPSVHARTKDRGNERLTMPLRAGNTPFTIIENGIRGNYQSVNGIPVTYTPN